MIRQVRGVSSRALTRDRRYIQNVAHRTPPLAFAFDIDGVLIRGKQAIPTAKKALEMLEGNNPFSARIPYILLTNGGGVSEKKKCDDLISILGHKLQPDQVILAHTVLKDVVSNYADMPILVLGGENDSVRKVAESYGFNHVYTTLDVLAWNSKTCPFYKLNEEEKRTAKPADFSNIPFRAAFVFHDPRHWSLDIQVLCDVLLSGGVVGSPHVSPSSRKELGIELVFCNPDLIWRSDFPVSRLGQGAFREAFMAVYKGLTGTTYPYTQLGKPMKITYDYARKTLIRRLQDQHPGQDVRLPNVYMVGDNPESDIAGANGAGWDSVLVHTGVYDPADGPPTHNPTHQTKDVEQAVKWAIEREMKRSS